MAGRRRAEPDPRQQLVRVVDRLSARQPFVTLADIERVAARASSRLPVDDLAALVEHAVTESLLLKDLRTFYDRKSASFLERWVYRVNPRHPLVADFDGYGC